MRWASFLSFGALSTDPPGPDVGDLIDWIGHMPNDVMREILPYLTSCMRDIAERGASGDVRARLLALYDRLTGLGALTSADADDGSDVMFKALNGPAGQIASGLLSLLSESTSGDAEVLRRLDALFDLPERPRLLALAMLVRSLTYLFRRERGWANDRLLPAMTDGSPDSVRLLGLWAQHDGNFDPLLFPALRDPLERALVSTEVDEESRKALTTVVTRVAFLVLSGNADIGVTRTDVRRMLTRCRREALGDAAWLIADRVAPQDDAWNRWVKPFFEELWPIDAETRGPEITRHVAMIPAACGDHFPAAVEALSRFIVAARTDSVFFGLGLDGKARALIERFPGAALQIAEEAIDPECYVPYDLSEFLDAVVGADPALRRHWRYRRLKAHRR